MTGAAVASHSEGRFSVMTGAAGLAFFHGSHGDSATLGASVVATLAAKALAVDVGVVAEGGIPGLDLVDTGAGYGTVTTQAIFLGCYVEGFLAVVAGTAGLAFFHFGHGEATVLGQVEDSAVAGFTVPAHGQVTTVAEGNRRRIAKAVLDVFGLYGGGHQYDQGRSKEGNNPPVHRNPP